MARFSALVLVAVIFLSGAQAQELAEGHTSIEVPKTIKLQPGGEKNINIEVNANLQCDPDLPGPRPLRYEMTAGRQFLSQNNEGQAVKVWRFEPSNGAVDWQDLGDGRWQVSLRIAVGLTSSGGHWGDVEKEFTWATEAYENKTGLECSPFGYKIIPHQATGTITVPAQFADTPFPLALIPAGLLGLALIRRRAKSL